MREVFEVLHPGLMSSFQDLGRVGYLSWGISHCGFMDKRLAARANQMVGNQVDTPLIEITQLPPKLKALTKVEVAVAIVGGKVLVSGQERKESFKMDRGEELKIILQKGVYGYIAIAGGFLCSSYANSVSHHSLTGLGGEKITKGQILRQNDLNEVSKRSALIKLPDYDKEVIRCYRGVDFDLFEPGKLTTYLSKCHVIHVNSNRMGIRTEPEKPLKHSHSIVSSPVLPGTIQLPQSGKAIILGQDGQSIGGYPRIGKIVEEDYAIVTQKRPGEKIQFEIIHELLR
jgi:biotin-dependent carboxylase-like uncharacterized protein